MRGKNIENRFLLLPPPPKKKKKGGEKKLKTVPPPPPPPQKKDKLCLEMLERQKKLLNYIQLAEKFA